MPEKQKSQSKANAQNSTGVFADYARYYDLLYRDKDYASEAKYISKLIHQFHPSAQSILELGSGTGIHASLLANKGFFVHGIERSPEMLTRSRSRSAGDGRMIFSLGDIREVRLNKCFDVVLSLFHVISYQTTNEDVQAVFDTARQHLKPGGIFIFDVWYGPAVLTERPDVRIKRMVDEKIEITRLAEPVLHTNENLVDVNYHVFVRDRATGAVKELQETHVMRYFFNPEIELIASHHDLKIINAEEWLTGKLIGPDTWGVCFTLQATPLQNN
jgi:SAM-dependent methyltransferase